MFRSSTDVPPPNRPPPPTPIQALQQRSDQLAKLKEETSKIPDREADKVVLQRAIDQQKNVVDEELAQRKKVKDLTDQSVNDPDPGIAHPKAHAAWEKRERQRGAERGAALDKLTKLRNANPFLYGAGYYASPCVPCMAGVVAAVSGAAKAGAASKAKSKEPPKKKNVLVKVEILNGFDAPGGDGKADPILGSKALQWVNLRDYRKKYERKALPAWLQSINGQPVASFDRLSRKVRVRVEFSQPGVESFIVKLVPGKNAAYSGKERAASSSYVVSQHDAKGESDWVAGTTDSDGKAIVEVEVRASGGDTWSATGKDNYGTQKNSSGSLETTRGLFVCTVTMDKVAAIGLDAAKAEFVRQKIHLEIAELTPGASGKVPHKRFLYADDRFNQSVQDSKAAVKKVLADGKFKGMKPADLAPYLIVSHFYDISPSSGDFQHRWIEVSPTAVTNYGLDYALWDPADTVLDWFIEAKAFTWDGTAWVELAPAPTKANFTLVGTPDTGYRSLKFTPPASYASEASISLKVKTKIIDGGVNGFSSGEQGQANFVAICRRSTSFDASDPSAYYIRETGEMNQTVVHEIGHKVNFSTGPEPAGAVNPVANRGGANSANFRWLDASPTHYVGRGHQGGHCYKDAVLNPTKTTPGGAVATSLKPDFGLYDGRCVMFGSGGKGSGRSIQFCGNCTPRMQKLDIETGWPSL